MKNISIFFFIILSSFYYAQEQQFWRHELFCELEVFNSDSNRWVISSIDQGCYGFFMDDNKQMILMKNYTDSTDMFYEIIETKNEFMHWTYKSINTVTKELAYFNYYRSLPDEKNIYYYDMLRIDFANNSIRYKKRQN